jgi:hypothetical protein
MAVDTGQYWDLEQCAWVRYSRPTVPEIPEQEPVADGPEVDVRSG